MLQHYFKQKGDSVITSKYFLSRTAPVLVISLSLAYLLKYDLLIVSGLLFCFWIFQNSLPKRIYSVEGDNNRLFLLVTGVVLLSKILFLIKLALIHHQSMHRSVLNPVELYQLCYLSVSYQSFGFVRRGLIPSVVQAFSGDYLVQLYLVQGIGFASFLSGLFVINKKKAFDFVQKGYFIPALLLSPVGIYYHSNFTFGFYDMTLIGLLFLSFSYRGHPAAVLFDAAGLLVHEAYIILRLPFLLFDLLNGISEKSLRKTSIAWLTILINAAVLLLIILWPRPGADALADHFLHQYASLGRITQPSDFDAFLPLSREGTLTADFNIMKQYYISRKFSSFLYPLALSTMSVYGFTFLSSSLSGRQRVQDSCCCLFSFSCPLLLGLVGADFGRWIAFSYITWLSYYLLFRPLLYPSARVSENCLYAVFLTVLLLIPFGYNFHPLFSWLLG